MKFESQRSAIEVGGAGGELDRRAIVQHGAAAHHVDRAADIAAPGERGSRAFGDLDALHVERVAEIIADIAHAIDQHVLAGREAAHREGIAAARRVALAGLNADAGDVAQRIAQRPPPLLLQHLV